MLEEISFESAGHTLSGTFISPESDEPVPAALLVSGSGPIDRDSNSRRLNIGVTAQVANRLADADIATLRYDKRGVGESEGDYLSTGFHDNVTDATAALAALRSHPRVDPQCVFVVGHSEGALIGAELGANDASISGIVMLAGAAQNGERILSWQMTQIADSIPGPVKLFMKMFRQDLSKTQAKRLARIKDSAGDVMRIQMVRINAKWFREFMAYEPRSALRRLSVPTLAITGSKDIQVDPADLDRIVELVHSDVTDQLVEDLTHLLRRDDGPASIRTYKKQARRPVDRGVLDLVFDWVTQRASAENGRTHEPV